MTGGLHCDTQIRRCYTNRYDQKIHAKATRTLFGASLPH